MRLEDITPGVTLTGISYGESFGGLSFPIGISSNLKVVQKNPSRFFGSISVEPDRLGSEARKIADEIIAHLAGLVGAEVEVTIDIRATVPKGVPENIVRTVTENCKALKFNSQGFENE